MKSSARSQADDLHRVVVAEAWDAIFVAEEDGRYVFVNRSACELLGYDVEELLRLSVVDLFRPEDQAALRQRIAQSRVDHSTTGGERTLVRKDGSHVVVELRTKTLPDGRVFAVARDIGARRDAERALRDSEARYRSVVQAMSDGIVVHGADGSIVTANAEAERVLGLTVEQMMGRSSLDPRWRSVREDGSPFPGEEHPAWVTLHTGEPKTGVIMGVHKPSGELTWISINSRRITPLGEEGAYSVVASFTDVTERRRADEKLRASLREKEVLLREIHHRVKNNLQIISSLLALQSVRTDDARLAELLRESKNRVASMALLHQRLYESSDLSEIPFGAYAADLARALNESYGVEAERIGLRVAAGDIVLTIGVAVPCGLILNEIISNALKHAFPGGRRGTITVDLESAGDAVCLRVVDDGVGLPDDFERRARLSLGVKLIERLVEQIGGELARTSSEAGTRYEVTFPREGLS